MKLSFTTIFLIIIALLTLSILIIMGVGNIQTVEQGGEEITGGGAELISGIAGCITKNMPCEDSKDCCKGLYCDEVCTCQEQEKMCDENQKCCMGLYCNGGICDCGQRDDLCSRTTPCCQGLTCIQKENPETSISEFRCG